MAKRFSNIIVVEFFSFHDTVNTRGHNLKMRKDRFRLDVGKFSFGNRIVDEWNCLPQEAIESTSVNMFKNRVDCHLKYKRGFKISLGVIPLNVGSSLFGIGPSC